MGEKQWPCILLDSSHSHYLNLFTNYPIENFIQLYFIAKISKKEKPVFIFSLLIYDETFCKQKCISIANHSKNFKIEKYLIKIEYFNFTWLYQTVSDRINCCNCNHKSVFGHTFSFNFCKKFLFNRIHQVLSKVSWVKLNCVVKLKVI